MKILIIEDELKIASALRRGLVREGYAVDAVYDGEQGLSSASDPEYDVIVLDRMLPGKDGVAIIRELREQLVQTPILMLTARSHTTDRIEGLDAGADDYLIKPFAFEELLARIRALLRRPVSAQNVVLTIGDLEIDTVNREVRRAGRLISLASKEYAVLEYMAQHPQRLITKAMLMSHVWDDSADILPNTVEVYINYLRKKIDHAFVKHPPLIHTVRGFGYKFGPKQ